MTALVVSAGSLALVLSLLPLRWLDPLHREGYVRADLVLYGMFAALVSLQSVIAWTFPAPVLLASFLYAKLALLTWFLFRHSALTAGRALLTAGLVYVFFIPFVMRAPLNGDEPYYLLATESMIEDRDLDLANQYRDIASSSIGRPDLQPHDDDPIGPNGERYGRQEPFLSILLIPGYALGGVQGALVTIALFGALLARSFVRLLEEEGVGERTAALAFALFSFTPPVMTYALRIWPEVPAAFFALEAVRGIRQRRSGRFILALSALLLMKLRFVPVAAVLILFAIAGSRRPFRYAIVLLALLAIPFAVLWFSKGNPLNVHAVWELIPYYPERIPRGLFGMLLDGASGILFQAPWLIIGVLSVSRWRELPASARIALLAAMPYLLLLANRDEWHGGWSPPLRYLVFLTPFLAASAAAAIDRARAGLAVLFAGIWSVVIAIHAMAFPWRLFAVAGGENFVGQWLSRLYRTDFSRLFPSYVRINDAAFAAAAFLIVVLIASPWLLRPALSSRSPLIAAALSAVLVAFLTFGRSPAAVVHLEDAHVIHGGGALDPHEYMVARFRFFGGWKLSAGDSVSFLFRGGPAAIRFLAPEGAVIVVNGRPLTLSPTGPHWTTIDAQFPADARSTITAVSGVVTLDRIDRKGQ
jgi:hypothetical protein